MKTFTPTRVNTTERMTPLIPPQMQKETSGVTDAHPAWLVPECIAGNEAAIEMFVHQYEASIFRLALSIVGDPAEASEITQETFIAALRSLSAYQEKQSFKAWLYTIALNYSRSHLRKRKVLDRLRTTLTTVFQIETEKQVSPEEAAIQNEKEAQIWRALNQLDERHRTVMVLRYFHELSVAEISEILSVNEGTIHSRLHNAREKLRSAMKNWYGE
ncbi:MAG TPA: RNA polymerase sigma factor [Anaerolineales bacterium]|nr:RNA polymerase sigma factor [Anaerolineales bacterium]